MAKTKLAATRWKLSRARSEYCRPRSRPQSAAAMSVSPSTRATVNSAEMAVEEGGTLRFTP